MKISSYLQALSLAPKAEVQRPASPPDHSLPTNDPHDHLQLTPTSIETPTPAPEPILAPHEAAPVASAPTDSPISVMGMEASFSPNGSLFLEDPSLNRHEKRHHYQEFHSPSELSRLPSELQTTWVSNLGISPQDFFQELTDSPKVKFASGDFSLEEKGGQAEWMEYNVQFNDPKSNKNMGSMSREIFFDESDGPRVYHSYLNVAGSAQGRGVAKDLLAKSMELYEQIGVKSISVFAALDVGGYAWAKYGFKPESPEATEQLFGNIEDRLDDLDISGPVKSAVKRLLADRKPENIWAISDLDGIKVETDEGRTTLGKALLLGSTWAGTLDLHDQQARARFDQYVNKGRADSSSNQN